MKKVLLLVSLLFVNYLTQAQKVIEPNTSKHPEWSKPYPPFQIAGNLYYVGTYDLGCYLIVTPQGDILINTGLAASAPLIKKSVETLGFKFNDIKILLTTQAHFDHMGAMATVKKMTGAKLMIDAGDAPVLLDGGRSDYAMGGTISVYQPVKPDRLLHNGDTVKLGGMNLMMLHHPGHTKGSCSYLFDVKDARRKYRVLIANMPTIITDKKFPEVTAYPNIQQDYAYTLNSLKHIHFDIWLATHGIQFDLLKKHKPGGGYNPAAFMDKKGYYAELESLQKEFDKKVSGK